MGGVKESFSHNFLLFRIDGTTPGKVVPSDRWGRAGEMLPSWHGCGLSTRGTWAGDCRGRERGPDSSLFPQPGL